MEEEIKVEYKYKFNDENIFKAIKRLNWIQCFFYGSDWTLIAHCLCTNDYA